MTTLYDNACELEEDETIGTADAHVMIDVDCSSR
jgi:hypothetical protein